MPFFKDFITKKTPKGDYYYLPSSDVCFCELAHQQKVKNDSRKLPFSTDLRALIDKVLQVKPDKSTKLRSIGLFIYFCGKKLFTSRQK